MNTDGHRLSFLIFSSFFDPAKAGGSEKSRHRRDTLRGESGMGKSEMLNTKYQLLTTSVHTGVRGGGPTHGCRRPDTWVSAALHTGVGGPTHGCPRPDTRVYGAGGKSLVTKKGRLRKLLELLEIGFFNGVGEKISSGCPIYYKGIRAMRRQGTYD